MQENGSITGTEEEEAHKNEETEHRVKPVIPRFDYNAPSSLIKHSRTGFLVTCGLNREKSATKEAISIICRHLSTLKIPNSECQNQLTNTIKTHRSDSSLSLVKLTRSGLVLIMLEEESVVCSVNILSEIVKSLESGTLRSPLWCHRILPIQATCSLSENELYITVSRLILQYVSGSVPTRKFAVGYDGRGCGSSQLDRSECFRVVAASVKEVIPDTVVDLQSPDFTILVEILPVYGLRDGIPIVGISIVPPGLVSVSPRRIKSLIK